MFGRPQDSVHVGATGKRYNSEVRSKTLLLVATFVLASGAVGTASAATAHTSQIVGFGYAPDPLHAVVGDSVRWENVAPNVDHTATVFSTPTNSFGFDTGSIPSGATSAPVLLTTAGSYTVVCIFHGTSMRQQLVVESATLPPDVPEAPLPVLVGLSGLALLGGLYIVKLRRHRAATVIRG
jgi:plastocyanin